MTRGSYAHRLRSREIRVQIRSRLTGEPAISSTQSVFYMAEVGTTEANK
jgi:hypothetical protein